MRELEQYLTQGRPENGNGHNGNGNGHGLIIPGQLPPIDLSRGVVVGDDPTKSQIRYHAENDPTWEHHAIASQLYGWTDRFRDRFLDGVAIPGREGRLPGPIVGFEPMRVNHLAYYILGKNQYGIEDSIVLNERHLDRPLYSILETLLHEQVHLWQQRWGKHPVDRNYHNQEFVGRCEGLGLHPFPVFGFHWKPADGPFEALLREYGILKPEAEDVSEEEKRNWWEGKKEKGKSTLSLYQCECGQKIRVGKKEWPGATCKACGSDYVRIDGESGVNHTLYQADEQRA